MASQYPSKPLLIVDNEERWINSLGFALEYVGGICHYRACSDSRQVMGLLDNDEFSLILLDLTMPHITGEELLKQIHHRYPATPVIIISGINDSQVELDCLKNGASLYLSKTTDINEMIDTIREFID